MKQVKSIYDLIKKQNGESFAKTIRNYDNGIFDIPDIVNIVKYAGNNAEPIINFLISLKNIQISPSQNQYDPFELLEMAGYDAYYADTLEKQNAIAPYFAEKEKLCTFKDNYRYQDYHIINAVKHNVDCIRREDFPNPSREDLYGTSVISIQILKNGGFISIKNRYNHTVENCDNTFSSNPDNIIVGLSTSLKKYFNVDFSSSPVILPENYIMLNNQIIKYNFEVDNIYFGDNFYFKNGQVYEINKDKEILMDNFIFNTQTKTIRQVNPLFQDNSFVADDFINVFRQEIKGKKIQIIKNDDKSKSIIADNNLIVKVKESSITFIYFPNTINICNNFCYNNRMIEEIYIPNLESIKTNFLPKNTELKEFSFEKLAVIEGECLQTNKKIEIINIPNVEYIGNNCFQSALNVKSIDFPKVIEIGCNFMEENSKVENINLPQVESIGFAFLASNKEVLDFYLPNVKIIGDGALMNNEKMKIVNLPNILKLGGYFATYNTDLEIFNSPKLQDVSGCANLFINNKNKLKVVNMPKNTLKNLSKIMYETESKFIILKMLKNYKTNNIFDKNNTKEKEN